MGFQQVRAFYDGRSCPLVMGNVSDEEWKELCQAWDEVMVQMLKDGYSLQEQGDFCIIQLMQFSKFFQEYLELCDMDKQEQLKEKCKTILKINKLDTLQLAWYGNVYSLLKLKRIKNDEENGWLFIRKNK
jgi:hypothetical protein